MGRTVLVTGAAGFIGSHLTERLVGDGHEVRVLVRYNGRDDRGHIDRLPLDDPACRRGPSRRPEGPRSGAQGGGGTRLGLPPGGLDRDPLFVSEPLRRGADERARHGTYPRRLSQQRCARAGGADLDVGGLRDRAVRADRREAPAPGSVALRGDQDRLRRVGRELSPRVRPAGNDPAAVQHIRSPPVGPGHRADDHQPGADAADACGSAASILAAI